MPKGFLLQQQHTDICAVFFTFLLLFSCSMGWFSLCHPEVVHSVSTEKLRILMLIHRYCTHLCNAIPLSFSECLKDSATVIQNFFLLEDIYQNRVSKKILVFKDLEFSEKRSGGGGGLCVYGVCLCMCLCVRVCVCTCTEIL